uniref:Uncharacterized protein n=1 Tax=Ochrobactrum sp. LM19 TaxID=1449781 RepID=A0A0D5A0C1_9HYPH|nr:hypothetical protein pLM19O2_p42 [Ochrobactrum sp. LM19]
MLEHDGEKIEAVAQGAWNCYGIETSKLVRGEIGVGSGRGRNDTRRLFPLSQLTPR